MNNIKLNKEQINEIREYLSSKGFRDPYEVLELLDHFTCKVEDILAESPDLPFEIAVYKARLSFGLTGLYTVTNALKKRTIRKYKKVFWSKFIDMAFSVKYSPVLLLIGYLAYKAWLLAYTHHYSFFGGNAYSNIVSITFWASYVVIFRGIYREYRKTYHYKLGLTIEDIFSFAVMVAFSHNTMEKHPALYAICAAIATIYGILYICARYGMIKTVVYDYKRLEEFLTNMDIA